MFAETVGVNQSETPIHSTQHLIGSCQRLLQAVASCIVALRSGFRKFFKLFFVWRTEEDQKPETAVENIITSTIKLT